MKRPRVVLADDHLLMLQGLRALLEPLYDVVAVATSGAALLEAVRLHAPDVVVSDISMPGDGFSTARQLREISPSTRIVFLTMNDSPALAAGALRLGISAYVLKTEAADELVTAIDAALAGKTHLSAGLVDETLSQLSSKPASHGRVAGPELTERQLEVLRVLGAGHTMKEIAGELHISPRTVAFHKYRIMEVMGAQTNAELIRKAVDSGLVEP